jgi:putative ABC transport system permease protein
MFKNVIKISLRNLLKHKVFSMINIVGLAIGISCCIIIFLFVYDELSYDTFHKDAERIYRVTTTVQSPQMKAQLATSVRGIGPALVREFHDIIQAVRLCPASFSHGQSVVISYREKRFSEKEVFYADPSIFSVFSIHSLQGDPKDALREPNSVIMTDKMAHKYFGNQNPLGQMIRINNEDNLIVTGIIQQVSHNSHLAFDFLISFATLEKRLENDWGEEWMNFNYYTYIRVSENCELDALQKDMIIFEQRHLKSYMERLGISASLILQPLTKIHLYSKNQLEIQPNGSIALVYTFSVIGFTILLIAGFNYINLTLAQSIKRIKEIGMRKTIGARPSQIAMQFLGESIFIAFIASGLAIIFIELALPHVNILARKSLSLNIFNHFILIVLFFGISTLIGLLAGLYPSLYLAHFNPFCVVQGSTGDKTKINSSSLKKYMIIFQFCVSVFFIIASYVIFKQLDYITKADLGFNKEHIIAIPINKPVHYNIFKQLLLENPNVQSVTACSSIPGESPFIHVFHPEGFQENEQIPMHVLMVDHDFLKTFNIPLKQGRDFDKKIISDQTSAFVLNEAACNKIGWLNAVGKKLTCTVASGKTGLIIGVIKDFHVLSLHHAIEPLVLHVLPDNYQYILIRILPQKTSETMAFLKNMFNRINPDVPDDYFFLNEFFTRQYISD